MRLSLLITNLVAFTCLGQGFTSPGFVSSLTSVATSGGGGGTTPPLIWWRMDSTETGGTTITDRSGNGYTGTLSGSPIPTWITTALAGGTSTAALTNVLSGYVTTSGNVSQMGNIQHASISFWFRAPSEGVNISVGFLSTSNHRFGATLIAGSATFYAVIENGANNFPNITLTGFGSWHFCVVTFDGTQSTAANRVVVYIDGTAQTITQGGSGNPTTTDTAANLGVFYLFRDPSDVDFSVIALDDVRLWTNTIPATGTAGVTNVSSLNSAGPQ
jgi:hypothetical protein